MKKLFFVALILCAASFAQTNVARMLSGVNAQTGTSYTFVASDVTKIVTFNNANPVGATLPVGTTSGFGAGSVFTIVDLGAGTVTVTCSGCTINGAASVQVVQNQSVSIYGDGTNYISAAGGGGGGGSSISGSTALGTQVGGNGAGGFASTTKPILDPRDFGVDCSGAADSSTALNALFTVISQREVDFPKDCQIRADHQIVIQSQSAWVIKGMGDRPGTAGFGGPSIYGCNGSAGALLYINRSGYGRIEGIGIYPKGPAGVCGSSSFTQSVQIDSTGNPGVTTHDIILDHLALTSSPVGTAITNYIGVSITDGGKQNGEMIKVTNNWIHCQNSLGSIGIDLENGTSDNDLAAHNNISSCKYGIKYRGNMRITDNLFSSVGINSVFGTFGAAIYLLGCSAGPANIYYNGHDSGGPFIDNDHTAVNGCASGFNVVGNMIGVSDIASGEYVIDVGNSASPAWNIIGNTFYVTQNTSQYIVGNNATAGRGGLAAVYDFGNNLRIPTGSNTLGFSDPSVPFQYGEYHFSSGFLGTNGLNNNAADASSVSHTWFPVRATGNAFKEQSPFLGLRSFSASGNTPDEWLWQAISDTAVASNSSLVFNHNVGSATSVWFNWDGKNSGLNLAQLSTPAAPSGVTPVGTPGGTTYTYSIVAYGQTGSTPGGATRSTTTGNASLDGTNYNLIQWVPTASIGANKWCVYRTVGGATQGKIGCVNAVGTGANSQNADIYFLNDTGLTGDASALPTINTTGKIITAASTTGAAGLNLPHGAAPTTPIDGDFWTTTAGAFVRINGGTIGPLSAGGGGGLSGMTALGIPIATSSTNIASSTAAGTNQGTYIIARSNTVQGSATTPFELQVGDCSGQGTITGATATYTIIYSDVTGCNIVHDIAGSVPATITIPTPATLHNPAPIFVYSNYSASSDTLSPVSNTIGQGASAAAATLTVGSGVACKVQLDPVNAATWKADCHPMSTSVGSVSVNGSGVSSPNFNGSTPAAQANFQNGTFQVSGSSVSVEVPLPTIPQLWLPYAILGEPIGAFTNQTDGSANNLVCKSFSVPAQITPTHVTADVAATSAGQTFNVGIYDNAGNLLKDSGSMSCSAGAGVTAALAGLTLTPGNTYGACVAISDTTCALIGASSVTAVSNIANKNATRDFTCANPLAAGAMPATCGVATPAATKNFLLLLEQ